MAISLNFANRQCWRRLIHAAAAATLIAVGPVGGALAQAPSQSGAPTREGEAPAEPPPLYADPIDEPMPGEPVPGEEVQAEPETEARDYIPIGQLTVDAALPEGLLPNEVHREDEEQVPPVIIPEIIDPRFVGAWGTTSFNWSATKLCHAPLYFEQVNLERYGYGVCAPLRPFYSGAHFFLTIPALPYKMVVHPPSECIYTLGYYRPGDRVPYRWNYPPFDVPAASVEAATVVGLIFLIP